MRSRCCCLFDWFCDWSSLILRYQLTQDEDRVGADGYAQGDSVPGAENRSGKSPEYQDWILAQRQKVLSKANLNRVLLLEALLVQWASLPTQR
jgi:DNA polymerase-3 subunit delta'